jgi:endonuclease I
MKCFAEYLIKFLFLPVLLSFSLTCFSQIPDGYYSTAHNLTGPHLKAALYEIIKGHIQFPYTAAGTDVWDILKETDRDTVNPENVILLYSGWSVDAAQEYNNGNGWTREQVWAKSHGNFTTARGVGTDVHHVRPVDLSVNSARNNKDFDWGGSLYTDGDGPTQCYSDADSWEPRDAVKGDIARMLFYMAIRYEGENDEPDLELVDDVNTDVLNEPGKGYHGKLSALLEWHKTDPVDSFEIRRNEVIYSYQKNRNPFIDHPEFADKIWNVTGIDEIAARPFRVYPNPANDFIYVEWISDQSATGSLFSADGNVLMDFTVSETTRLRIPERARGVYFLRINAQNKLFTEKIILGK